MISVAIPTHQNRVKWFIHNIKKLYDVVDEFVVVQDGGEIDYYNCAKEALKGMKKVRVYRSVAKVGAFRNKYNAVSLCTGDYVAILDSDNTFGVRFIEAFKKGLDIGKTPGICCPIKALPRFDFTKYRNLEISKENAGQLMSEDIFCVLMNTGNYIVDRKNYLSILKPVFGGSEKIPQCCDVVFANYHLLKAGEKMYVIDGMKYYHLDHEKSTYRMFVEKEPEETLKWQNMVRTLK